MAHSIIQVVIIAAILLAAWYVVERFSPDPLLTKLCQIAIFVIAVVVIVMKLLPMAGLSF